jgi:hypothetical protein
MLPKVPLFSFCWVTMRSDKIMLTPGDDERAAAARVLNAARDGATPEDQDDFRWCYGEEL